MSLPRLLTAIRALPPTPFRTTGQPQLFDALEGIVARTLSLPADAGDAAIEAKQAGMSDSMRRRVKAAEDALGAIEANKALDKLRSWAAACGLPSSSRLIEPHRSRTLARVLRCLLSLHILTPTSYNLLHPAHDPEYYERMLTGVRRSQQGIGRSWWKRFFQVRGSA
ncbi:hypothetical protein CcaverHIS002_0302950 [Cutaneotrichosporon cavernicola]|nr:hypothetical protein CcaverHIS002_0302950 [Cutaneotrichosporon cavernicola]